MGCGCGGGRRVSRTNRPAIGPGPSMRRGIVSAKTPTENRLIARQNMKNNKGIPGNLSISSVQKRAMIEKKRRALIIKKLGK